MLASVSGGGRVGMRWRGAAELGRSGPAPISPLGPLGKTKCKCPCGIGFEPAPPAAPDGAGTATRKSGQAAQGASTRADARHRAQGAQPLQMTPRFQPSTFV